MENNKHCRPTWDEYFMKIVEVVGSRGTCDRGRCGCIIVKDRRIVSTGYVGSPIGLPHCDEAGHEMHAVTNSDGTQSRHCIRTTHAEQNAIAQAARIGLALEGSTLYCKMTPCYVCAKMIINAGIVRVVCAQDYHGGARSKEIFAAAGLRFNLLSKEMTIYADMAPGEKKIVNSEQTTVNSEQTTENSEQKTDDRERFRDKTCGNECHCECKDEHEKDERNIFSSEIPL